MLINTHFYMIANIEEDQVPWSLVTVSLLSAMKGIVFSNEMGGAWMCAHC